MSSSKCSFNTCICGTFLPLKPFHDYSLCSVCILLQPALYTQSAFYPWSAVCSLQSAGCVLHWPVMKSESWRRHYKFFWDVPGESSFSMADSKLNESPEMVLLIYRNLFFPNHTIITHETRGEYSIFGETVLFFFQLPGHSHWRILIQSNLNVQPPLASNHLS